MLKNTINQLDIISVYRIFNPITVDYTLFSNMHETCSTLDHILVHKTVLNKLKVFKL